MHRLPTCATESSNSSHPSLLTIPYLSALRLVSGRPALVVFHHWRSFTTRAGRASRRTCANSRYRRGGRTRISGRDAGFPLGSARVPTAITAECTGCQPVPRGWRLRAGYQPAPRIGSDSGGRRHGSCRIRSCPARAERSQPQRPWASARAGASARCRQGRGLGRRGRSRRAGAGRSYGCCRNAAASAASYRSNGRRCSGVVYIRGARSRDRTRSARWPVSRLCRSRTAEYKRAAFASAHPGRERDPLGPGPFCPGGRAGSSRGSDGGRREW